MSKRIQIAAINSDDETAARHEATGEEIKSIFELAEKIPDSWLDMDMERLAQDMARYAGEGKGKAKLGKE